MKRIIALLAFAGFYSAQAQTLIPAKEVQIRTAVMAAPSDKRDGAMVYGYSATGDFVILRNGTNELICLADDPKKDGFSVTCYHRDLESFMARGRYLKKALKTDKEVFDIREEEVKSGKLLMPKGPTTLLVYYAAEQDFNKGTGEVVKGNFRYVVYIPYATAESTGLPLKEEAPGMPWLMNEGTHRAHIMITPPPKN